VLATLTVYYKATTGQLTANSQSRLSDYRKAQLPYNMTQSISDNHEEPRGPLERAFLKAR